MPSGREFIDTNLIVYAFDLTAGAKRDRALALLDRLWMERAGCVSLQVLQEFYVTVTRKLGMDPDSAAVQVQRFGRWTVHRPAYEDVLAAIESHGKRHLSYWDALILQSARRLGCSILWSEDLAHGQSYDGVAVRSPFAPDP